VTPRLEKDLETSLFSENKSMVLEGSQKVCSDESLLIFKRIGVKNEAPAVTIKRNIYIIYCWCVLGQLRFGML